MSLELPACNFLLAEYMFQREYTVEKEGKRERDKQREHTIPCIKEWEARDRVCEREDANDYMHWLNTKSDGSTVYEFLCLNCWVSFAVYDNCIQFLFRFQENYIIKKTKTNKKKNTIGQATWNFFYPKLFFSSSIHYYQILIFNMNIY